MIINDDILRQSTVRLLSQIEFQIEEVKRHAKEMGIEGYQLRDANGGWAMSPLLLAKATAYGTLVQLQTKK